MAVARASAGMYSRRIAEKITGALHPTRLAVEDESHKHRGHRESSDVGETHFRLEIVSPDFEGQRLLERHRRVYDILADELNERVHALALRTMTPAEDVAAQSRTGAAADGSTQKSSAD